MAAGDITQGFLSSGSVQTTDATTTTVCSWTIPSSSATTMLAICHGTNTGAPGTNHHRVWMISAWDGGASASMANTNVAEDDNAAGAWTITADSSAYAIRVRVTGAGGTTIRWSAKLLALQGLWA